MKLLVLVVLLFVCLGLSGQINFYNIPIDSAGGTKTIDLASFRGKRILIVIAASQDSGFVQYDELKQLYQQCNDSLVIIVTPSNSFNTEPGDNQILSEAYTSFPGKNFILTAKIDVRGADIHPLYAWLTSKALNGRLDSEVQRPFQKYLVGGDGNFMGIFSSKLSPLSTVVINALKK